MGELVSLHGNSHTQRLIQNAAQNVAEEKSILGLWLGQLFMGCARECVLCGAEGGAVAHFLADLRKSNPQE